MNWIRLVRYISLFGFWYDCIWNMSIRINFINLLLLFGCGSQTKHPSCLIAWIILRLLNVFWNLVLVSSSEVSVSGIEFLWIALLWFVPPIALIYIVWRAKKQIDNEALQQLEEIEIN